ncbi:MAG: FadR/GntR family transcriptional regulator, partial [Gemmataceae bacterium]
MVRMKPVKKQSLVDTVVERIQTVIRSGHYGPGDRLPTETELIKQLEVSRTVLREAIGRLEAMGLVSVQGSRGMFVGDTGSLLSCVKLVRSALTISPRELRKFTEFRCAIECEAARHAAARASTEDLAELEAMCEEIGRPELNNLQAFELDFRFHRKLLELTGNELMFNVMEVVREFVLASIVEGGHEKRDPQVTQSGHRAILQAIRAADPDAAERAMREHMNAVLDSLEELEKQEDQALPSAS